MTPNPRRSSAPLTVRRLAQQGGVTVHVVRNYLRRGLLRASSHTDAGYQLFAPLPKCTDCTSFALRNGWVSLSPRSKRSCGAVASARVPAHWCATSSPAVWMRRVSSWNICWRCSAAWPAPPRTGRHLPDSVPTGNDVCALIEAIAASEAPPRSRATPKTTAGTPSFSRDSLMSASLMSPLFRGLPWSIT